MENKDVVKSEPTMCLGCHIIVILEHSREADPVTGAWVCPNCGREYPFKFYKVRRNGKWT